MKYTQKQIIVFLILTLVFSIGIVFFIFIDQLLYSLGGEAIVLKQFNSPDRHYTAQYCDSAGNATVGLGRLIRIIDQQDPLKSFKHLLQGVLPGFYNFYDPNDNVIMAFDGTPEVQLQWQNRKTLIVTYPKNAVVYGRDKKWHDIRIIYLKK